MVSATAVGVLGCEGESCCLGTLVGGNQVWWANTGRLLTEGAGPILLIQGIGCPKWAILITVLFA